MSYQVLARKWRPQDFSSLIGQQPIVTALRNGLAENRIAQAYLFSGIRGVGKTTAARILAKALNCERRGGDGPAADPCNECPSCLEITAGSDLDVQEVDAATYSKVEQVRELTESLRYGPARDRYKVVVLDEVHRLSRQAFDALLKIVEEPPPHLVFIFATTEIDAVPATILSRCQEYQFRRVPSAELVTYLRQISDAEEITVSDAALRLIARAGEGSVRDSVALLDQLATFGGSEIRDRDALDLLGGLDAAVYLRLLEAILAGERLTISEIVREIEANGWDPHNVYGQFLGFARDALELAMGGTPQSVDLPLEEAESLARLATPAGYENLLRMVQLLLTCEPSVRRSEFGILALEIAWLRAAELPRLTRVEDLLAGHGTTRNEAALAPPTTRESPAAVAKARPPVELRREPAGKREAADEVRPPETSPQRSGPSLKAGTGRRQALLERLRSRRPSLAALFKDHLDALCFDGHKLLLPAGDEHLARAVRRKPNRELFEELLREVCGESAAWGFQAAAPASATETVGADDRPAAGSLQEVEQDPAVRTVLDLFQGSKIQSVEPYGEENER